MTAGTTPAVRLDAVSVHYDTGGRTARARSRGSVRRALPVLDVASLTIAAGDWVAIIGPNGAGKSSMLKAIVGLIPYGGTIERAGDPNAIAYVPQRPALPAGMTVAEYVLLGRSAHLGWLEVEGENDRAIVDSVLARLDLASFAGRPVHDLSGGEVQRVTLARALAQRAETLVLDEPTSALDIGHRVEVLELIDDVRRSEGLTVISAMHDLSTAGRFADRLLLLDRGEVVADGTAGQVLSAEVISRHYQTAVQVFEADDGAVVVTPLRAT